VADLAALLPKALSQVDELLAVAEDPGPFPTTRTRVSGWTALEHAEHMARADEGELYQLEQALQRSGSDEPRSGSDEPRGRSGGQGSRSGRRPRGITLAGRGVLALGWIPRGIGKAPEIARPAGVDRAQVAADLRRVREEIAALAPRLPEIAAGRGRASHPIFGGLTPAQWVRVLYVHHHHHLKIIRDIRRAFEAGAAAGLPRRPAA